MAVTFTTERAEDADTTNASTYAIGASFTPGAGSLLVCVLVLMDNAATFSVSTLADGTNTWTNVGFNPETNDGTTFQRTEVWYTQPAASAITVTMTPSEALTGTIGWIGEFAGHNTTTPIKQSASQQVSTTDPNISLASPPDADSLVLTGGHVLRSPPAWTEEAGWTEHMDVGIANPTSGAAVWSKANDQTFTATGTDQLHGSWILEIDAAAVATPGPEQGDTRRRFQQLYVGMASGNPG